jgi:uncharacterized protein (TIGR02300 family)
MTTASQDAKALRGTKRVCQACETRFYDLMRDPMVCPSCGAQFALAAMPVAEIGIREAAPQASKTAWRSARPKRPEPPPPEAAPAEAGAADDIEEADEQAPEVEVEEDDTVLEPEVDEADVSGLIDHDVVEPKER